MTKFAKAHKEVKSEMMVFLAGGQGPFTADNVWLPCIPINIDSTGAAVKRYDAKVPKKARRTVGGGSPETLERFSFRLDIFLRSCCPPLKVPVKLSFRGDVGRAQMCLNSVWVTLQPHISANTPRWATISAAVWTACSRRTRR